MDLHGTEQLLSGERDEDSQFFQSLRLDSKRDAQAPDPTAAPESFIVAPKPGFCLKTWKKDDGKLFVNVCTSHLILEPRDVSEEVLAEIVQSEDPTRFRVPMGISALHHAKDKSEKEVDVYDIVIHSNFLQKILGSVYFKEFFLTLVFDALEEKFSLTLTREFTLLKNRKQMGALQTQNVRSKSKPVIMEMDPNAYTRETSRNTTETPSRYVEPVHAFRLDNGMLRVEVQLPKVATINGVTLDVGEDCLIVDAPVGGYRLDVDLPQMVDNESASAEFDRRTRKLVVTVPVQVQD